MEPAKNADPTVSPAPPSTPASNVSLITPSHQMEIADLVLKVNFYSHPLLVLNAPQGVLTVSLERVVMSVMKGII